MFALDPWKWQNDVQAQTDWRWLTIMRKREGKEITLADLINKVKADIDYRDVGMIACHNGVVRGTSRDGRPVRMLEIEVNAIQMESVLAEIRQRNGISAVEAHVFPGERNVGDDVMLVVVAGDFRENVFRALEDTVNRLKEIVVHKRER